MVVERRQRSGAQRTISRDEFIAWRGRWPAATLTRTVG